MRFLIGLEALKDSAYDRQYYHKLQGFLYGLISQTGYKPLHDKKGYKFFCFSNIFPANDMKAGDKRTLVISSPDKNLISFIYEKINLSDQINVGEMLFSVSEKKKFELNLRMSFSLITGTPIIIRIPKKNFEKYGISPEKPYEYVFWKPEYDFSAFIKQLEENIFKKYSEFYKQEAEKVPLFQEFKYLKSVSVRPIHEGKETIQIGSTWQFNFNYLSKELHNILRFAADSGFGEMNSLGFGFMNMRDVRNLE